MELKQAIESRTSVRNFLETQVPVEDLKEMVRLASCAPSVNNYQPWKFIAITNKPLLNTLADVVSEKIMQVHANESKVAANVKSQVEWYATFFRNAPAVIAITMEGYESILEKGVEMSHDEINKMRNYPDVQSAGAAIENLLLAAVDMGYGACWMSAPMIAQDVIEKALKVIPDYHLVAFVALGRPVNPPRAREKKAVEEIFSLID